MALDSTHTRGFSRHGRKKSFALVALVWVLELVVAQENPFLWHIYLLIHVPGAGREVCTLFVCMCVFFRASYFQNNGIPRAGAFEACKEIHSI